MVTASPALSQRDFIQHGHESEPTGAMTRRALRRSPIPPTMSRIAVTRRRAAVAARTASRITCRKPALGYGFCRRRLARAAGPSIAIAVLELLIARNISLRKALLNERGDIVRIRIGDADAVAIVHIDVVSVEPSNNANAIAYDGRREW